MSGDIGQTPATPQPPAGYETPPPAYGAPAWYPAPPAAPYGLPPGGPGGHGGPGGPGGPAPAYPPAPTRQPSPRGPATIGVVSLSAALVGVVTAVVLATIAGLHVGSDVLAMLEGSGSDGSLDLAFLSPVRGWVLLGEIGFWIGTVLGILAIVLGGVAIARRRGFGVGIAGVVVAAAGPIAFAVILTMALSVGAASGSA